MASRCYRCLRRIRRNVLRLTSPKFWNSLLHNRCHAWFGGLARKSVILIYTFYEVLACVAIGYYYCKFPQAAKLSLVPVLTDYKFFSFAMFVRGCFGIVGVAAAYRRKVRMMRFYFFTLPASVLCAGIVAGPLVNMRCSCAKTNFEQCMMAIAYKPPNELVNTYPNPSELNFADPPRSKPKKSNDNVGRIASSAPLFGRRLDAKSSKPSLLQLAANFTFANRSARRSGRSMRSIFFALARRLGQKTADETFPGGQSYKSLRRSKCTCKGRIKDTGNGLDRPSCKYFWKDNRILSSWCQIDPKSENACRRDKIQLHEIYIDNKELSAELAAAKHKRFWSEDLCVHQRKEAAVLVDGGAGNIGGCVCSKIGMELIQDFATQQHPLDLDMRGFIGGNATLGNTCKKWRYKESRPWCFVGFDSNCSDRREYVVPADTLRRLPAVDIIEQVSQFRSSIPCQDEILEDSEGWCRTWRNLFCFILLPLTFGPVPMAVIIYLFLRNRCGDLATFRAQFNVNFSSSSSEDDFEITDEQKSNARQQKSWLRKWRGVDASSGSFKINGEIGEQSCNGAQIQSDRRSERNSNTSRAPNGDKSFSDRAFSWAQSRATMTEISLSGSEDEDGSREKGRKMRMRLDSEEELELAADPCRQSRLQDRDEEIKKDAG